MKDKTDIKSKCNILYKIEFCILIGQKFSTVENDYRNYFFFYSNSHFVRMLIHIGMCYYWETIGFVVKTIAPFCITILL